MVNYMRTSNRQTYLTGGLQHRPGFCMSGWSDDVSVVVVRFVARTVIHHTLQHVRQPLFLAVDADKFPRGGLPWQNLPKSAGMAEADRAPRRPHMCWLS